MTGSWHEYDTPKDLFQVTYFFQVDPISKVSRTSKIVPSSGDKASNIGIFWREALHIQTIQWFEKHIWEMLFHMNILRLLFWKWYRFTTDLGWSREYTNTTVMEKRSSENLSPVTRKQGLCVLSGHTHGSLLTGFIPVAKHIWKRAQTLALVWTQIPAPLLEQVG